MRHPSNEAFQAFFHADVQVGEVGRILALYFLQAMTPVSYKFQKKVLSKIPIKQKDLSYFLSSFNYSEM